jgi:signal transduction histidine kinase
VTGDWRLDWPVLTVSLFNTIVLVWLGLTVLLNAERRDWGVWLVGGGILAGAVFFVSHTALVGIGFDIPLEAAEFWWQLGWIPLVLCPLAWYVAVLWYARYWEPDAVRLRRRHRPWLTAVLVLAAALLVVIFFTGLLPSVRQLALYRLGDPSGAGRIPVVPAVLVVYLLLPVGLSLDALNQPVSPDRAMEDAARVRAKPWLTGAALLLLAVCLAVGGAIAWLVGDLIDGAPAAGIERDLAVADLALSGLMTAAVLTLGQGIVRYEIFTGRSLPRRGLQRGWRRAVILATGYSLLVGAGFALDIHPVYSLLLTAGIMTVFFALLYQRFFLERERLIVEMQPFVTSDRLYDRLLSDETGAPDAGRLFDRLCRDLLGAERGYLVPVGGMDALVAALAYPAGEAPEAGGLAARFETPAQMTLRIPPESFGGAGLAVSLWGVRGLAGLLLLGEKTDGSLYGQEEIEVARAVCERLVNLQAGAELTRRLVAFQRERLAESQVADRRVRRTLHDEVLPALHTAILRLSAGDPAAAVQADLASVHRDIAGLLSDLPPLIGPDFEQTGVIEALRGVVEGELAGALDRVEWAVAPEAEVEARDFPALKAEVLFHAGREALRNAARHARRADRPLHVCVRAMRLGDQPPYAFRLEIEDDGAGFDPAAQPLRGLRLHGTLLAIVGGELEVESEVGVNTRIVLSV